MYEQGVRLGAVLILQCFVLPTLVWSGLEAPAAAVSGSFSLFQLLLQAVCILLALWQLSL